MDKHTNFIKTTLLGGLIFLIPFVIIIAVLDEALSVMVYIAEPLAEYIPIESIAGVAVVNLIGLAIIILCCFLAGLMSLSSPGKRVFNWFDSKMVLMIPGYAFIRSFAGNMKKDEEYSLLKPVFAKLDDFYRIGFEVERLDNGLIAVFLPGSPDAMSGYIAYMPEDIVKPLDTDFSKTYTILSRLGRGSGQYIK
jgi:uncharacterized membrane protein